MAENYVLEAQPRTVIGKKVSKLRREGLVPVSLYGPRVKPVNLQIAYRPLQIALMKAGGTNLIDIKVDTYTQTVLARQVQRDVLRGDILHVDFFVVDLTERIRIDVPVHFINESPAVITRKGILITGPTMVTIETLPSNLLSQIEIDLSGMNEVGDAIHIRDLALAADITIINDPDEMIARISQTSAARSEEGEEEEGGSTPGEVEIIRKGKEDEEDED